MSEDGENLENPGFTPEQEKYIKRILADERNAVLEEVRNVMAMDVRGQVERIAGEVATERTDAKSLQIIAKSFEKGSIRELIIGEIARVLPGLVAENVPTRENVQQGLDLRAKKSEFDQLTGNVSRIDEAITDEKTGLDAIAASIKELNKDLDQKGSEVAEIFGKIEKLDKKIEDILRRLTVLESHKEKEGESMKELVKSQNQLNSRLIARIEKEDTDAIKDLKEKYNSLSSLLNALKNTAAELVSFKDKMGDLNVTTEAMKNMHTVLGEIGRVLTDSIEGRDVNFDLTGSEVHLNVNRGGTAPMNECSITQLKAQPFSNVVHTSPGPEKKKKPVVKKVAQQDAPKYPDKKKN